MAILDELKNKIGDKANKANNIQEAVAEMPMLEPLYLVGDPSTFDAERMRIRTNVKWVDALEAFKNVRKVIARIDLRSMGQTRMYGDVVVVFASYALNQMGGAVIGNTITVFPSDADSDDAVAVLRIDS